MNGGDLTERGNFRIGKIRLHWQLRHMDFFELFDSISHKVQQTESFSIVLNFSRTGYVAKIGGFRSGHLGVLFRTMIFDQPQPLVIKNSLELSLFT